MINKVKIKSWFFEKMEFSVDTRKYKNGLLQLTQKPIHKNRIVVISYERFRNPVTSLFNMNKSATLMIPLTSSSNMTLGESCSF